MNTTSPQFSLQDRRKADETFTRSRWTFGLGLGILFFCLYTIGVRTLHAPDYITRLIWAFGWVGIIQNSRIYAIWRVRQAGLSAERVERHYAQKSASSSDTEPFVFRDREVVKVRVLLQVFPLLTLLLFLFIQLYAGFTTWEASQDYFDVALFVAAFLAFIYYFLTRNSIVLKLDEKGLSSRRTALPPRFVPWSQVADVEEVRRWNYRGAPEPLQLNFRDSNGKSLLRIRFRKDVADSVATQIEARFRGDS